MSWTRKTINIPPVIYEIDGARVYVLEVSDFSIDERDRMFLVSLMIEVRGYRSPVFHLLVRTNEELLAKIRAEIARMKLMLLAGMKHLFQPASS